MGIARYSSLQKEVYSGDAVIYRAEEDTEHLTDQN